MGSQQHESATILNDGLKPDAAAPPEANVTQNRTAEEILSHEMRMADTEGIKARIANFGRQIIKITRSNLETAQDKAKSMPPYFKSPKTMGAGVLLLAGGIAVKTIHSHNQQAKSQSFWQKTTNKIPFVK